MKALLALLLLTMVGCITTRPPAPDASTRNAGIAHKQLLATYRSMARTADTIARRTVPVREVPNLLARMCHQQCDAQYFRCVMASMPGITIPGMDERAPKDFPSDIPECTDPDCTSATVTSPAGTACTTARDACDKRRRALHSTKQKRTPPGGSSLGTSLPQRRITRPY